MTFDELLSDLETFKRQAGYKYHEDPDSALDMGFKLNEIEESVKELREMYAPTVELTQEQKNVWDIAIDVASNYPKDFIFFVDNLENVDEVHGYVFEKELTKFRHNSKDLMNMWLHPKSIKVVD